MDIDATQAIDFDVYDEETDDEEQPKAEKKPVAYLKVLAFKNEAEKLYPIYDGENFIGRDEGDCAVCLPFKSLSKKHACIEITSDMHLIYDLESRNKTRRDKLCLHPQVRYELKNNDRLMFADVKCVYEKVQHTVSTEVVTTVSDDRSVQPPMKMTTLFESDSDTDSDRSSDILQPTQGVSDVHLLAGGMMREKAFVESSFLNSPHGTNSNVLQGNNAPSVGPRLGDLVDTSADNCVPESDNESETDAMKGSPGKCLVEETQTFDDDDCQRTSVQISICDETVTDMKEKKVDVGPTTAGSSPNNVSVASRDSQTAPTQIFPLEEMPTQSYGDLPELDRCGNGEMMTQAYDLEPVTVIHNRHRRLVCDSLDSDATQVADVGNEPPGLTAKKVSRGHQGCGSQSSIAETQVLDAANGSDRRSQSMVMDTQVCDGFTQGHGSSHSDVAATQMFDDALVATALRHGHGTVSDGSPLATQCFPDPRSSVERRSAAGFDRSRVSFSPHSCSTQVMSADVSFPHLALDASHNDDNQNVSLGKVTALPPSKKIVPQVDCNLDDICTQVFESNVGHWMTGAEVKQPGPAVGDADLPSHRSELVITDVVGAVSSFENDKQSGSTNKIAPDADDAPTQVFGEPIQVISEPTQVMSEPTQVFNEAEMQKEKRADVVTVNTPLNVDEEKQSSVEALPSSARSHALASDVVSKEGSRSVSKSACCEVLPVATDASSKPCDDVLDDLPTQVFVPPPRKRVGRPKKAADASEVSAMPSRSRSGSNKRKEECSSKPKEQPGQVPSDIESTGIDSEVDNLQTQTFDVGSLRSDQANSNGSDTLKSGTNQTAKSTKTRKRDQSEPHVEVQKKGAKSAGHRLLSEFRAKLTEPQADTDDLPTQAFDSFPLPCVKSDGIQISDVRTIQPILTDELPTQIFDIGQHEDHSSSHRTPSELAPEIDRESAVPATSKTSKSGVLGRKRRDVAGGLSSTDRMKKVTSGQNLDDLATQVFDSHRPDDAERPSELTRNLDNLATQMFEPVGQQMIHERLGHDDMMETVVQSKSNYPLSNTDDLETQVFEHHQLTSDAETDKQVLLVQSKRGRRSTKLVAESCRVKSESNTDDLATQVFGSLPAVTKVYSARGKRESAATRKPVVDEDIVDEVVETKAKGRPNSRKNVASSEILDAGKVSIAEDSDHGRTDTKLSSVPGSHSSECTDDKASSRRLSTRPNKRNTRNLMEVVESDKISDVEKAVNAEDCEPGRTDDRSSVVPNDDERSKAESSEDKASSRRLSTRPFRGKNKNLMDTVDVGNFKTAATEVQPAESSVKVGKRRRTTHLDVLESVEPSSDSSKSSDKVDKQSEIELNVPEETPEKRRRVGKVDSADTADTTKRRNAGRRKTESVEEVLLNYDTESADKTVAKRDLQSKVEVAESSGKVKADVTSEQWPSGRRGNLRAKSLATGDLTDSAHSSEAVSSSQKSDGDLPSLASLMGGSSTHTKSEQPTRQGQKETGSKVKLTRTSELMTSSDDKDSPEIEVIGKDKSGTRKKPCDNKSTVAAVSEKVSSPSVASAAKGSCKETGSAKSTKQRKSMSVSGKTHVRSSSSDDSGICAEAAAEMPPPQSTTALKGIGHQRGRSSVIPSTGKQMESPHLTGSKCQTVNAASPKSLKAKPLKPKVMFTGVVDENGEKIVKGLGGEMVDSIFECSHLVTDQVRRTVKFLCGVARGLPIVTPEWLEESKRQGVFVDVSSYLVKDKTNENKFKFSLTSSLQKAAEHLLLSEYKVHVTKNVKPEPNQMRDIIQCAGGQYLASMPRKSDDRVIVVSCDDDAAQCHTLIELGIPVVSSEFILTGILRQQVDTDTFRLSSLSAPTATLKAGKRCSVDPTPVQSKSKRR